MINHKGIAWQARQVQDALLRWVYRGGADTSPRG